jgi:phospholipid/cholesterol/gamma-HCH transport system substrate-binding protein
MDLAVGASILVALCILIVGTLWLKESFSTQKQVTYTAVFPNVGTLQTGDPVMVNGVSKGRVAAIYLRNSMVATVLRLDRDVALTDSCRVVVQNVGLMGERGVGVQLARSGATLKPNRKGDTTFIPGRFDTGIAEAMGMMGTVLSQMESLIADLSGVAAKTVGDSSFISLFHRLSGRLDTLTAEAQQLVARNGPLIDRSAQNLADVSAGLKTTLDQNSERFSTIMSNGEALSADAVILVRRVDSLSASIAEIVHDIHNGRGALGMALQDEQFSKDLRRAIDDLDSLAGQVRKHGIKVKVRL